MHVWREWGIKEEHLLNWKANVQTLSCKRVKHSYLCYWAARILTHCLCLYLLGFTCISAKQKLKHDCFPGTLGTECWAQLWSDPVWLVYWKESIFVLNVLGFISLFYKHWHGHPKPRMIDSVLRVLAFVLKVDSRSPPLLFFFFFALKKQTSNLSLTRERLHKSLHLMESCLSL